MSNAGISTLPTTAVGFSGVSSETAHLLPRPFTRQPSICLRSRCRPCPAYQRVQQGQAQAIAIPWNDTYGSEWDPEASEQQEPLQTQRREFAVSSRVSKPLKINRDLLLVSALRLSCGTTCGINHYLRLALLGFATFKGLFQRRTDVPPFCCAVSCSNSSPASIPSARCVSAGGGTAQC